MKTIRSFFVAAFTLLVTVNAANAFDLPLVPKPVKYSPLIYQQSPFPAWSIGAKIINNGTQVELWVYYYTAPTTSVNATAPVDLYATFSLPGGGTMTAPVFAGTNHAVYSTGAPAGLIYCGYMTKVTAAPGSNINTFVAQTGPICSN
ncbi:hypothetical protein EOD41_09925 [Mucilaginibacter limnophilus]|uniref:Uncharacterized protein n=1 Tax=Mucilaginibacter limnophilus TaxID=1932778 RepID=A0A437MTM4_9SPHI|nr:hypothetical protein [Mucilaginibacter limnophilus]RVU00940.1 hypothetical protein EOD41_09925 [Mucilaginibacter limnophilus]